MGFEDEEPEMAQAADTENKPGPGNEEF
jgi:hypothetical protein